jgi:hypothetical protein
MTIWHVDEARGRGLGRGGRGVIGKVMRVVGLPMLG